MLRLRKLIGRNPLKAKLKLYSISENYGTKLPLHYLEKIFRRFSNKFQLRVAKKGKKLTFKAAK